MTKPFNILRKKMSLPAQKAAESKKKRDDKRNASTGVETSKPMSLVERRTDMYISTLRSYIEAMGGKLDIIAKFPDGEVYINQFEDIHDKRVFG